eukprot:938828-Prymnesium_polylepis.1
MTDPPWHPAHGCSNKAVRSERSVRLSDSPVARDAMAQRRHSHAGKSGTPGLACTDTHKKAQLPHFLPRGHLVSPSTEQRSPQQTQGRPNRQS